MLELINQEKLKKEDVSDKIEELKIKLLSMGNVIKNNHMPVIISFDGWSASGKGRIISKLIKNFDPRFFHVESVRTPNEQEKRKPWLCRFWTKIPAAGEFLIMDRSWYRDTVNAYMFGEISKSEMKKRLNEINTFERQLTDDGCIIIKFFMHISEKEQDKRIGKLEKSDVTNWRVDKHDKINMSKYDEFFRRYDHMLEVTNTDNAPWYVIGADNKYTADIEVFKRIYEIITGTADSLAKKEKYIMPVQFPTVKPEFPEFKISDYQRLCDIDMDKSLTEEEYQCKLKKYQERLFILQNRCYQKKIPVIIGFEGWDAAGKGGSIKRLAAALDPRGYEVKPIAAPEPHELARHYLYRFWTRLENDGHFTIFDRTWYGRVMVESIEKFTPEKRVKQAYREINEFENYLVENGAVVIKFWINITNDEQLKRFNLRMDTPEKRWKITDEDWRNRSKWNEYEFAVNKMFELTSTENCPWTVIEGNDKKYARIKVLETVCRRLEKILDE